MFVFRHPGETISVDRSRAQLAVACRRTATDAHPLWDRRPAVVFNSHDSQELSHTAAWAAGMRNHCSERRERAGRLGDTYRPYI